MSVASAILEKDPEPISVVKPMTPPALDRLHQEVSVKGGRATLAECWRSCERIAVDRRGRLAGRKSAETLRKGQGPQSLGRRWHSSRRASFRTRAGLLRAARSRAASHSFFDLTSGKIGLRREREFVGDDGRLARRVAHCGWRNWSSKPGNAVCSPARRPHGPDSGRDRGGYFSILVARRPLHRIFCGWSTQNYRCLKWTGPGALSGTRRPRRDLES